MKAKNIITIAIGMLISLSIYGQGEIEALRYSQMYWGGTARFVGAGGAFGAVGADFSALLTNPASMGIYKKSEVSFSPTLQFSKAINNYNDVESEDFKYNCNYGSFGIVLTVPESNISSDKPQWKYVQFGFGVNRVANYKNNIIIEGGNRTSSIMDAYINKADGNVPSSLDQFSTQLAYDTYLINDHIKPSGEYYYSSPLQSGDITQKKTINISGSMNETVLSLSGNYNDKFFIGGTIGFVNIDYKQNSFYEEFDRKDTMKYFKSFSIEDDLKTTGSGTNFKFGVLYQPFSFVRFGGAIHTPTFFYKIEDEYSTEIKSDIDTNIYSMKSPDGTSKYELNTPIRYMANIAFIINKAGFISCDYEYTDYSQARLRSSDYSYRDENKSISDGYIGVHSVRVGAEYNFKPILLRGGYALYTSPFKSSINDGVRSIVSGGIGIRSKGYFLDFAYSRSTTKEKYYLYDPSIVNASYQTTNASNFILSMGVKF